MQTMTTNEKVSENSSNLKKTPSQKTEKVSKARFVAMRSHEIKTITKTKPKAYICMNCGMSFDRQV